MVSVPSEPPELPTPSRGSAPAVLVGQGGQDASAGSRFTLDREVTLIGRAEDCDLRLADPLASRHHAEIRRESWRYLLVALDSRNGTRVNGVPVAEPYQLEHGDALLIATTPFRF